LTCPGWQGRPVARKQLGYLVFRQR
jgi:hypothetical protein